MKRVARLLAVVLVGAGSVVASAQQQGGEPRSAERIQEAITLPNKEYQISFPTMGVVKEVRVKEGEAVKKDQVLMVQDNSEELAELKILELDANNRVPIDAAKAKLRVAEVEFKAKDELKKVQQFVELEWERAKAQMEVATHEVAQAERELEMKAARRDKQAVHVKRMELRAPADGVVYQLVTDLGANVDPTKPSISVVENNPLKVEVQVPALTFLNLKKGDKMRVSYDKKNWKEAAVSMLSPKAEAGSGWRTVYLELPNPEGDPSGLQAYVELPEKVVAAAAGK